MSSVETILRRKGTDVVTVRPDISVLEAARAMNQHRIGCVVVTDEWDPRRVVGILTERDILIRLVAAEKDPVGTRVKDIMTRDVNTCTKETPVQDLRAMMRSQRIRHVPVCDGSGLCGLVSIGDVNALEAEGLSATIVAMEEYITRA
jgi:CBS domain-containing protein